MRACVRACVRAFACVVCVLYLVRAPIHLLHIMQSLLENDDALCYSIRFSLISSWGWVLGLLKRQRLQNIWRYSLVFVRVTRWRHQSGRITDVTSFNWSQYLKLPE